MNMKHRLKKLRDQVIVITGASSGIGLTTARMAAKRGVRLVLAARSEQALRQIVDELQQQGCQATYVVADVSKPGDHERIAETAEREYAGFDTWVNNAAISIYGRVLDVPLDEQRQLFEIDFWGTVYGSRVACEHLRKRGGALINVGSTVSDRAIPLQGTYSAAKHAVKGWTDTLRMEIEEARVPISVTLIKPGSIDTPFPEHAKNYLGEKPNLPPPVYAPETVADAILHCAEHAEREVFVGAGGAMISSMGRYAPRLADKYMEMTLFKQQRKDEADYGRRDGLYEPTEDPRERGGYEGLVQPVSLYTKSSFHPLFTGALLLAGAFAAAKYMDRLPVPRRSAESEGAVPRSSAETEPLL
jgi:short-subunit dehydrogenase